MDTKFRLPYPGKKETDAELFEFKGAIIDIFEELLAYIGYEIVNNEKDDSENPAIIYGSDYDWLSDAIDNMLLELKGIWEEKVGDDASKIWYETGACACLFRKSLSDLWHGFFRHIYSEDRGEYPGLDRFTHFENIEPQLDAVIMNWFYKEP